MSLLSRPLVSRPLFAALAVAFSCSAWAAKPVKAAPPPAKVAEPTSVELAHNLGEASEGRLQAVVDRYNRENNGKIKLVRLERDEKLAPLNLVTRYDLSELLARGKQVMPLHEAMAKGGKPLKLDLSPELKSTVSDGKGRLVALPLVYSTPVLFYNKNALRKAKLDPERPPQTWFEMQVMLDKLQDAGFACPYTSTWPVWVHIDNMSAVSGLPAVSDRGELAFNGLPQVKHIAMMTTWVQASFFKIYGRRNEASQHFHNGECAMITTNSREAVDFADAKGVDLGVAPLPYHDDVYGGRQPTLADGAALWVGAGHTPGEYKEAAKFVSFLLSPQMQTEMVKEYGGLPMTSEARAAVRSSLLKDASTKALDVAYASLKSGSGKPAVRVSSIDPLRIIANDELEAIWNQGKPAKAALDTSVSRGNAVLGAKPWLKKAQPF